MLKQCPSLHKRACCYCGKWNSHNRCLYSYKSFVVTGQDHNPELPVDADLSSTNSPIQLQQSDTSTATGLTQSLLASGEKAMLQTAVVSIQSFDGSLLRQEFHWTVPVKEHS